MERHQASLYTVRMAFKDRLIRARRNAGLTQAQIAERLGVSDKAVSGWERGMSPPRFQRLSALANILGTTTGYLMDDEAGLSDIDRQLRARLAGMKLEQKKRALRLLDALDE